MVCEEGKMKGEMINQSRDIECLYFHVYPVNTVLCHCLFCSVSEALKCAAPGRPFRHNELLPKTERGSKPK